MNDNCKGLDSIQVIQNPFICNTKITKILDVAIIHFSLTSHILYDIWGIFPNILTRY